MIVDVDYNKIRSWIHYPQCDLFLLTKADEKFVPDSNVDSHIKFGYKLAMVAGDRDIAAITPGPYMMVDVVPGTTFYFYVPRYVNSPENSWKGHLTQAQRYVLDSAFAFSEKAAVKETK